MSQKIKCLNEDNVRTILKWINLSASIDEKIDDLNIRTDACYSSKKVTDYAQEIKHDLEAYMQSSINEIKEELDDCITKDAIATTLDDSVTDEQVASALLTKTELDKTNAKLGDKADKSYVDDNFATIDKVERFSTTEIPIGTWIDGKTIYRTYVSFPSFEIIPCDWNRIDSLSITGIHEIINARAKRSNDNAVIPLGAKSSGTSIEVNTFTNFDINALILEYTKQ